jgi:hypothetical protein
MDNQKVWVNCLECREIYEEGTMFFDDICDECAEFQGYDIGKDDGDGQPKG